MPSLFGGAELSDESLMVRVQAGDSIAYAELYSRHMDRSLRVARAVGLDARGAEEAFEAAFAAIWRRRADFRAEAGGFRAWSMMIVHNQARDSLRGGTAVRDWTDGQSLINLAGASPDAQLTALLGRLPEASADVVTLAFHGELSYREIAVHLSLSEPPVAGRMRLAMAAAESC